jgi:hypothetical protein
MNSSKNASIIIILTAIWLTDIWKPFFFKEVLHHELRDPKWILVRIIQTSRAVRGDGNSRAQLTSEKNRKSFHLPKCLATKPWSISYPSLSLWWNKYCLTILTYCQHMPTPDIVLFIQKHSEFDCWLIWSQYGRRFLAAVPVIKAHHLWYVPIIL